MAKPPAVSYASSPQEGNLVLSEEQGEAGMEAVSDGERVFRETQVGQKGKDW